MQRYPRSFIQLVTFGYSLVVIPFLLVTGYAFITLRTLDGYFHGAIEGFSETSRMTVVITEDLIDMERNLRRYEVLRKADSLDDYAHARLQWQTDVQALLRAQSMPQRVANDLQALVALENDAYAVMRNTQSTTPLRSTIEEIKLRLQKVRDQIQSVLVQDQARFKDEADVLRQRLLLAMGVAVLATVSSIWAARRLLARLIGRFERVVLRLGKGDLQQPIDLHGPSDMRWLGRWLEWLRRRLLSLEESRTQVLRHVSHELKTPLAAMREGANLLAEEVPGTLTVEQSRIVHILQGNAQRLQSLIEGLLRLQQAGHIAECIGFESLRLDRLIEQVLETSRLIAADKHLEFKSVLAEVEIVAGQEGVLTIVHNLLSNAVKFSPDGGRIGVELSTHREQAVLDVSDEGPGIAAQDRPHIFEPFYRSSASRAITGVGLGLAIAREFVLAHQGELLVLDSPTGAHFRVTLPLNAPLARTRRHA